MVKHIVMFQLKKDLSNTEKMEAMNNFRQGILALPEKIDVIINIEVGLNINEDEQWDICLNSTFNSLEDVRSYAKNPAHVAVGAALKPFLSGRSCVDYEI